MEQLPRHKLDSRHVGVKGPEGRQLRPDLARHAGDELGRRHEEAGKVACCPAWPAGQGCSIRALASCQRASCIAGRAAGLQGAEQGLHGKLCREVKLLGSCLHPGGVWIALRDLCRGLPSHHEAAHSMCWRRQAAKVGSQLISNLTGVSTACTEIASP